MHFEYSIKSAQNNVFFVCWARVYFPRANVSMVFSKPAHDSNRRKNEKYKHRRKNIHHENLFCFLNDSPNVIGTHIQHIRSSWINLKAKKNIENSSRSWLWFAHISKSNSFSFLHKIVFWPKILPQKIFILCSNQSSLTKIMKNSLQKRFRLLNNLQSIVFLEKSLILKCENDSRQTNENKTISHLPPRI